MTVTSNGVPPVGREVTGDGRAAEALRTTLIAFGATAARLSVGGALVASFGSPGLDQDALKVSGQEIRLLVWGECDDESLRPLVELLELAVERAGGADPLLQALVETQSQLLSVYAFSRIQAGLQAADETDRALAEAVAMVTKTDAVALVTPRGLTVHGQAPAADLAGERLREALARRRVAAEQFEEDRGSGAFAPILGWPAAPEMGLAIVKADGDALNTSDMKLVTFLAEMLSSTLGAIGLQEERIRRATIEQEHDLTARLAQAVLPSGMSEVPGCRLVAASTPARSAGGDFYSHAVIGGQVYFAVGDVAGKGLPAALVMTKVIASCAAGFARNPADLDRLAELLCQDLHGYLVEVGLFVTAVIGRFNPATGLLELLNAGHSPVLTVIDGQVIPVRPVMPPFGVLPHAAGQVFSVTLGAEDMVVVGSDGLAEQEDQEGEQLGYPRFLEHFVEHHALEPGELLRRTFELVARHSNGVPASDDQTLLVLRRTDVAADGVPPTHELTLEGTYVGVRQLGPWVEALCAGVGVGTVVQTRLELALHELCINVADHAYGGTGGAIRIKAWAGSDAVRLELRDRGLEFHPDRVRKPRPGVPQVRGYGLGLIEKLAQEIKYERGADENIWTLVVRWETRS